jgi:hypothetical protein
MCDKRSIRQSFQSRVRRPAAEVLEGRQLLTIAYPTTDRVPAEVGTREVVLADFNGDGALDLAAANVLTHRVGIWLNAGDGTFGPGSYVVAGASPVALAAADLDADGALDLVVTNVDGNNISVLPGRGDGTFGRQTRYDAGDGPLSVAIADLDGDGALDLAVGNSWRSVSLFYGRGDGSFEPQASFDAYEIVGGVAVADMDADGLPDLLVNGGSDVHVYLNQGARAFSWFPSAHAGAGGTSVAAGDLNGDGHFDVVRSNTANGYVSVFLGDGTGELDGPYQYSISGVPIGWSNGEYPYSNALVDLDLDGCLDMVVATTHGVVVFPGLGDGTFRDSIDLLPGSHAQGMAIGDVDGDGRPDIATTYLDSSFTLADEEAITILRSVTTVTPAPVVALTIEDVTAIEGDAGTQSVAVAVRLSAATTEPVTIAYATAGGTAAVGQDYEPAAGVLTFAPGQTEATFFVPVVGNLRVDGARTIGLILSSPTGPSTIADGEGVLSIEDNEVPSTFRFRETFVSAGPGAVEAVLTVERDDDHSDGVSVAYSTSDGTAVAGVDFVPTSGILRFAPGQTALQIRVPLIGDAWWTAPRVFGLALSGAEGGSVGRPSTATVLISPAAPVAVESVVATQDRRGVPTFVISFGGPIDAASVRSLANYRLIWAGRDGKLGTRDDRTIAIKSVNYRPGARSVTLTPRLAVGRNALFRLTASASITDTRGLALDGDRDGLPGRDFEATIRLGAAAIARR